MKPETHSADKHFLDTTGGYQEYEESSQLAATAFLMKVAKSTCPLLRSLDIKFTGSD
jgi:hypothetical protein